MADVTEQRAEIAGTEVVWHEAPTPDGRAPVLYVHGVPNSGEDWLPFLERSGGIAPHLPGFGRSDKSNAFDYSIPGYAAFLRAFVEHLGLERFSMVVHDWGVVGLALAQEVPERIERLVVSGAVPLLPGYRWHPVARIWRTPLVGELYMGVATPRMARFMARRMRLAPPERIDELVEQTYRYFDHGTQRAILRLYRSGSPPVLARAGARLGDITAPALIVWGEREPFIPISFAHGYAKALGGDARVEIVKGAGHWFWIDKPASIDLVTDFLAGERSAE